jgi:hypothetical protein
LATFDIGCRDALLVEIRKEIATRPPAHRAWVAQIVKLGTRVFLEVMRTAKPIRILRVDLQRRFWVSHDEGLSFEELEMSGWEYPVSGRNWRNHMFFNIAGGFIDMMDYDENVYKRKDQ